MAEKPTYEELEQRLQELERIFNFSTDMIGSGNLEGDFIKINSAFGQILGYTEEEFLAKPFISFIHDEDVEKTKKALIDAIKGKKYIYIENRYKCKDGSHKWIEWKVLSIVQENKFIAVGREISDRKQVEKDLRKERHKSQHYLDIAGVILVAIDTKQNVMMINKKGCEILGYEEHEIVGKKWFNHFIKAEEAEEITRVFNQIISEKIEVAEYYENAILTKSRGERILAWRNSLIRDESGRIIGTLSSGEDITDRKQAEEALNKTNERLEQQVKERTVELKERNTALRVLLEQRQNDKKRLEKTIMLNIKKLIKPNLTRLKKNALNNRQKSELAILEANLNEIVSPFESYLSSEYLKLTSTEIQIANFIKNGVSSKEIAGHLGLSQRTVDAHRYNIREKIGIKGKGVNLKTYLTSLT